MKRIVGWQRHDTAGVEYAEVETDPVGGGHVGLTGRACKKGSAQ